MARELAVGIAPDEPLVSWVWRYRFSFSCGHINPPGLCAVRPRLHCGLRWDGPCSNGQGFSVRWPFLLVRRQTVRRSGGSARGLRRCVPGARPSVRALVRLRAAAAAAGAIDAQAVRIAVVARGLLGLCVLRDDSGVLVLA